MKGTLTLLCLTVSVSFAADPQNPSPMVEHTREHPRLTEQHPEGQREQLDRGIVFVPQALRDQSAVPLLVFLKGGTWIPEVAAARTGRAVLHWQTTDGFGFGEPFEKPGAFTAWIQQAAQRVGKTWNRIEIGGWSAGCGGIRQILVHEEDRRHIDAVLLIDGVHSSYADGKPGPLESKIDTTKLASIATFAREAMAGTKSLLLLHTEIFPGTYASTTETADWLLHELNVKRTAVLKWGPMSTQQLSEASAGRFLLRGYAGNSAPDHIDLLHALPDLLSDLDRLRQP